MAVSSAKGTDSDAESRMQKPAVTLKRPRAGRIPMRHPTRQAAASQSAAAKGTSTDATAAAENGSSAKATASGTDSFADASATMTGSDVTALATNGSSAIGSDTAPPTCTPKKGGVAQCQEPDGKLP